MGSFNSKTLSENPAWAKAIAAADADAAARRATATGKRAPAHVTGRMNGTEARYAGRLAELVLAGEVAAWEFERWTLRLDNPDNGRAIHYRPDFRVLHAGGAVSFDEVKGGFVRRTGDLKFRWACEQFPREWFRMWQWKDGAWALIREHKPKAVK